MPELGSLPTSSECFESYLCPQGTHSRAHSHPKSEATSRSQAVPNSGARHGNEEAPGNDRQGLAQQGFCGRL